MKVEDAINKLRNGHGYDPCRKIIKMSFGSKEVCKQIFVQAFKESDETIKDLKWLPEYDDVIDWMVDNKGKGLLLSGDCGRGKSNIINGAIPIMLYMKWGKVVKPIKSKSIFSSIKTLEKQSLILIDEVGEESITTDYGAKFEAFNHVINDCEDYLKILIASTNLDGDTIVARYGERTLDRLNRLCKIVKFKGNSLRT